MKTMRYLVTLLLAALSLNALGQVNTVGTIIYSQELSGILQIFQL